jgi:hypothetical protein
MFLFTLLSIAFYVFILICVTWNTAARVFGRSRRVPLLVEVGDLFGMGWFLGYVCVLIVRDIR